MLEDVCGILVCACEFVCVFSGCIDRMCQNQGMIFHSSEGLLFFLRCMQCINLDRHNYFGLVYFLPFIPYLVTFLGTISFFFSNMVRVHEGRKKWYMTEDHV